MLKAIRVTWIIRVILLGAITALILHNSLDDYSLEWPETLSNHSTEDAYPLEDAIISTDATNGYSKETHYFISRGVQCEAWLYLPFSNLDSDLLPDDYALPPLIIMAHGFGAQKNMGLDAYAAIFADHGMAVLAFDYRTFGGSRGLPRNWISPSRHIEDWLAAVRYARDLRSVNSSRIGLFGTSFSGGHVLVAAARLAEINQEVAAVASQMPFLDGKRHVLPNIRKRGFLGAARLLIAGLIDVAFSFIGSQRYLRIVSRLPDVASLMPLTSHDFNLYMAKNSNKSGWKNLALARVALEISSYRPISYLERRLFPKNTPLFVSYAGKDSLCPPEDIIRMISLYNEYGTKPSIVVRRDHASHFDMYSSRNFDVVGPRMVHFFKEHLDSTWKFPESSLIQDVK